ncbi:hypothetical protein LZ31DRAFT_609954 [Colletotrichum somersetense]|nr:hypothetical protein LZ31DRAFT_609954 [Colletotrichum somersetense]
MAEDLDEEIAPAFSALHFPSEGLFVRLNACSPKDGAQKVLRKVSLHSATEIIFRLVPSGRCRAALEDCLNASIPVELFFLPFDKRMAPEREFRVFCRPEDCRITGINRVAGTNGGVTLVCQEMNRIESSRSESWKRRSSGHKFWQI